MAQNIPFQEQKYAQPGPQTVATNIAGPGQLGLNILAFLYREHSKCSRDL
jgi:hypothetical protein